jgi:hypothetical protein
MPKLYRNVRFNPDGTMAGEWNLPGSNFPWVRFDRARLDLLWIELACAASKHARREIWASQDGYGEPGYTPEQGWDWSGIRDSSPDAMAVMLAHAVLALPWPKLCSRLQVGLRTDPERNPAHAPNA